MGMATRKTKAADELYFMKLIKSKGLIENTDYTDAIAKKLTLNDACLYEEPTNHGLVDTFAKEALSRFIGSICYTDEVWIMMTQLDLFIRNRKEVDDCAIITEGEYPLTPQPKITRKNTYGKSSPEMSIFFLGLEFLVVGCLFGQKNSQVVNGSLGPSLKLIESAVNVKLIGGSWKLLVPSTPQTCFFDPRLLQNYSRVQSGKNWSACGSQFVRNGFRCSNPLYLMDNTITTFAIASKLIRHVACDSFTEEQEEELVRLLKDTYFMKTKTTLTTTDSLEFLDWLSSKSWQPAIVETLMALIKARFCGISPRVAVNGDMETKLYNTNVRSKYQALNKALIEGKKLLL